MYRVHGVTHTQSTINTINTVKIQVPTLQLAGESVSKVQQNYQ